MSQMAELYQIADELRAIATMGLTFSDSSYDLERYTRTMSAAARLVTALEETSATEIFEKFQDNLFHVSPLAGAEVAVVRDGKLLLIRRHDNGLWALPGGLVDIGETLAEAALRELWEEVYLRGTISTLLGIFDSRFWRSRSKTQMNHFIFQVEIGDSLPAPSPEAPEVDFFAESELPELSPGHDARVPIVFKLLRRELPLPYFDFPGEPLPSWKGT
ncbi:MAG: NUDIX hydrolase N-terminal domain-containing protein [Chloroflexi bacterium]|nr:NUDIX hydrolase N-terminal domain-containing protein [Chloroflexota bacterium]